MGNDVRNRCGGGVDNASWAYQNDGRYRCRMSRIRTDSVGEEDRGHAIMVPAQYSVERAANEAAGQLYKQTTEFVYLSGAIIQSADLDTEIKSRIGAPLGRVSEDAIPKCTTDGTPGCRSRSGDSKLM